MIEQVMLEPDEIRALQRIREINCNRVACCVCPLNVDKNIDCMPLLAKNILEKIGYEPNKQ